MNYEDLFYTLCGKIDDDHPNDTDPQYMATYAEIIDLVNKHASEQGLYYYKHKVGQCKECGENMELVRILTKSQFISVVKYIVRQAKPQYTEAQKLGFTIVILNKVYEKIDELCVNCGVEFDKYGTFGLHVHIIESFFRHASEQDLWDKDEQKYLYPPVQTQAKD